jgi:hypothetical protein
MPFGKKSTEKKSAFFSCKKNTTPYQFNAFHFFLWKKSGWTDVDLEKKCSFFVFDQKA